MENYGYLSAMKKYVTFSGRAPRKEYWMFTLIYFIISIAALFVDVFLLGSAVESIGVFGGLAALAHFLPSISVLVRRLHDINRSGWWILIILIPLIGILVLLYWAIKKSDSGENSYGPNPYGVADVAVFD